MNDPVNLWRQIHESFKHHIMAGDPTAQAAMERVAMKCLGLAVPQPFNALNCTVRGESLDGVSLHELKFYHPRAEPQHPGGPIVVLLYEGKRFVIDGNNRVGEWIEQKSPGPFKAIIVEPRGENHVGRAAYMETRQGFREKLHRVYKYLDDGIVAIFGMVIMMILGPLMLVFYGVILLLFYAVVMIVFRAAFGVELPNPFYWLKG